MKMILLLWCLSWIAWAAESPQCRGADCLVPVKTSHGTRCGANDSLEVDVKNASGSLYLLGYVVFLTPAGTQNEATGLLAPGAKTNVYVCHALGSPTFAANTSVDKDFLRYPDTRVRDRSGLVVRECDSDPDGRAQLCQDEKGGPDAVNRCLAKIRRCGDGRICAAGACVDRPSQAPDKQAARQP